MSKKPFLSKKRVFMYIDPFFHFFVSTGPNISDVFLGFEKEAKTDAYSKAKWDFPKTPIFR